jgi:hypothetical protein
MRRILVDNALRKYSRERGGACYRVNLDSQLSFREKNPEDVLAVNAASGRWGREDPPGR